MEVQLLIDSSHNSAIRLKVAKRAKSKPGSGLGGPTSALHHQSWTEIKALLPPEKRSNDASCIQTSTSEGDSEVTNIGISGLPSDCDHRL